MADIVLGKLKHFWDYVNAKTLNKWLRLKRHWDSEDSSRDPYV
jgi:hypothetical protein